MGRLGFTYNVNSLLTLSGVNLLITAALVGSERYFEVLSSIDRAEAVM